MVPTDEELCSRVSFLILKRVGHSDDFGNCTVGPNFGTASGPVLLIGGVCGTEVDTWRFQAKCFAKQNKEAATGGLELIHSKQTGDECGTPTFHTLSDDAFPWNADHRDGQLRG
jgi:hypothetical protein